MPQLLGPSLAPPDARRDRAEMPDLFPEPPVDRWGRYNLQGKTYTRATTVAHALDDAYNLHRWQERQVVVGLTQRPALWQHAVSLHPDDKDGLNKLCEDAREAAGANDAARIGSARHRLFEYLDAGRLQLSQVTDPEALADAQAYYGVLAQGGLRLLEGWIESVIVVEPLGVAGTIDRAVLVNTPQGPVMRVLDLKTSKDMKWSYDSWAMQVAIYSRATHIWERPTDRLTPLVRPFDQTTAYILHAPAGTGTAYLHQVDLVNGEDAWAQAAVDLAMEVRKVNGFGKRSMTQVAAYDPRPQPEPPTLPPFGPTAEPYKPTRAEMLRARCERLIKAGGKAAADAIASRWPVGVPRWGETDVTYAQTDGELDLIDQVVTEGESVMGLPLISDAELWRLRPEALGAELAEETNESHPSRSYNATTGQWEPAGPQPDGTFLDPQGVVWKEHSSGHWLPQPQVAKTLAQETAPLMTPATPENSPVMAAFVAATEPSVVVDVDTQTAVSATRVERPSGQGARHGFAPKWGQPDVCQCGEPAGSPTHSMMDEREIQVRASDTPTCIHCGVVMEWPYSHRADCFTLQPVQTESIRTNGIPPEVFGKVPPQPTREELDARRPYSGEPAKVWPEDYYRPTPMAEAVATIKSIFPGAEVVDTIRSKDPRIQPLLERIERLPADLRGELDSWKRREQIPSLGSQASGPQSGLTDEIVTRVEAQIEVMEERQVERVLAYGELMPDSAAPLLASQIIHGPYMGLDTLTKDELEAMSALYRAGELGLVWATADGGVEVNPEHKKAITDKIKAQHGAAQAVKLAAQRWAVALKHPEWRCTTMKAAAEHPVIAACLALGPAIETPESFFAKAGPEPTEPESESTDETKGFLNA